MDSHRKDFHQNQTGLQKARWWKTLTSMGITTVGHCLHLHKKSEECATFTPMGLGICGGPFKVMGCISLLTMALKLPEQFRWVHRPAEAGHKGLQMGSQENWWAGRQEHQDGGG